jgi:hypothetical protein
MHHPDLSLLTSRLTTLDLDTQPLPDGSAVMLDLDGHRVLNLSPTAALIVRMLQSGVVDRQALLDKVLESFDVDRAVAASDLDGFLHRLQEVLHPDSGPNDTARADTGAASG